jgi:hypothetical protein
MPRPTVSRPVVRHASAVTIAALVTAIALAGCNGITPTPSPIASPASTSTSSASPETTGAIDHKTGATDVILRMERGGGFVPIAFLATQAPTFTLYGNGVIVFKPRVAQFPQPDATGVTHNTPWRTAKLDEGQVQELLGFAITQGGLGTARAVYLAGGIADAPSTIFALRAGGLDKTVTMRP